MRIVSYNIRKAIGLDWRRDPQRIIDVLGELEADVVVLQEADRRIGTRAGVLPLDELKSRLGYEIVDVSIRPRSHGWHGNVVLLRHDMPAAQAFRIDLPTLEPRGAIGVALRNGPAIIGAHLGLTRKMRKQQIAAIMTKARSLKLPCIVAGDFNERQPQALSAAVEPEFRAELPGKSFHAARPAVSLDGFLVRKDILVSSSAVHQSPLASSASDHLPVYIDVEFEGHRI